tara:strand:+ start:548 stop:808 length:261 start_codon:yes stop_codon:yes gene_type:complete
MQKILLLCHFIYIIIILIIIIYITKYCQCKCKCKEKFTGDELSLDYLEESDHSVSGILKKALDKGLDHLEAAKYLADVRTSRIKNN